MEDNDLRERQHFAMSTEQEIRKANNEIINPVVGNLSKDRVVAVAVEVAKRRAAYIDETLKLGEDGQHHASGEELKTLRQEYEEAREAFGALMTTIERGYVNLATE